MVILIIELAGIVRKFDTIANIVAVGRDVINNGAKKLNKPKNRVIYIL